MLNDSDGGFEVQGVRSNEASWSQRGLAVSISRGEGTVPETGGWGSCLSVCSGPAPWLDFREAWESRGGAHSLVRAVLTAPRLPRVPGAPAAPRQTGRLSTFLAYSLLHFRHHPEQSFITKNNNNYLTITATGSWGARSVLLGAEPLGLNNVFATS